jgi:hypothetical protein
MNVRGNEGQLAPISIDCPHLRAANETSQKRRYYFQIKTDSRKNLHEVNSCGNGGHFK